MIYSGLASEFGIVQQKAKLLNAQIEDEGYRLSLFDGDEESGEGGTILYLLLVVERWCPNQNNNNNNNREKDDATTVLPESANRVKALALSGRCKMRIRRNPPFRSLTFLPLLFLGLAFCSRVNEETMMYGKTASLVRTASRSAAARRQFASEPKMHKAKDFWADLKAKRPIDHDEEHVRTTVLNCKFFEIPNSLTTFLLFHSWFSTRLTTRQLLLVFWLASLVLESAPCTSDTLTSNTNRDTGSKHFLLTVSCRAHCLRLFYLLVRELLLNT